MAGNTEQKFISIYKAYVDEIYQYIFLRTGFDVSLAEDLTQDTFLEVYKSINRFRGLCSERTWVLQAAGFHESKGAETAGRSTTRQAGRGGGRELQDNEGHAVSNGKPLTVGAIHP